MDKKASRTVLRRSQNIRKRSMIPRTPAAAVQRLNNISQAKLEVRSQVKTVTPKTDATTKCKSPALHTGPCHHATPSQEVHGVKRGCPSPPLTPKKQASKLKIPRNEEIPNVMAKGGHNATDSPNGDLFKCPKRLDNTSTLAYKLSRRFTPTHSVKQNRLVRRSRSFSSSRPENKSDNAQQSQTDLTGGHDIDSKKMEIVLALETEPVSRTLNEKSADRNKDEILKNMEEKISNLESTVDTLKGELRVVSDYREIFYNFRVELAKLRENWEKVNCESDAKSMQLKKISELENEYDNIPNRYEWVGKTK